MDPRVFTPPALLVIEAGKFERGIARRMPSVLPKGAAVLGNRGRLRFLGLPSGAVTA